MVAPFSEYRLPSGRHGLAPELVAENQRRRLLGAGAVIFTERGYAATTSRLIARRAAVSSSTFYAHFDSVPALLQACFELAAQSLLELLPSACGAPATPLKSTELALEAALGFAATEPELVSLLGLELSVAEVAVAAERQRLIARLSELLSTGGRVGRDSQPAPATAELLVAAALAVVVERSGELDGASFAALVPELTQLLATTPAL
jgi:AcrR family transcriptional regulator